MGTSSSDCTTNRLWLAGKSITALLTATELSPLALELVQSDGWELSSSVVLSFILVNLVDGDGGVDDGWLDSLPLDDWLDVLVYVMVDVLTGNGGVGGLRVLRLADGAGVLELGGLGG
jgi:hypothetical protein